MGEAARKGGKGREVIRGEKNGGIHGRWLWSGWRFTSLLINIGPSLFFPYLMEKYLPNDC